MWVTGKSQPAKSLNKHKRTPPTSRCSNYPATNHERDRFFEPLDVGSRLIKDIWYEYLRHLHYTSITRDFGGLFFSMFKCMYMYVDTFVCENWEYIEKFIRFDFQLINENILINQPNQLSMTYIRTHMNYVYSQRKWERWQTLSQASCQATWNNMQLE